MLVKLDQVLELNAVKVPPEVQLGFRSGFLCTQSLDQRLGMDLPLNIDRHCRHFERMPILFVLAFPDELRVQGRIARVEYWPGLLVLLGEERAQFRGRDVAAPRLAVDGCLDMGLLLLALLRHLPPPSVRALRCGRESRPSPCTDRAIPCSP